MIRWLLQSTLCLILCPLLAAQQVAPPTAPADAPQNLVPTPTTAKPRPMPEFITIPGNTEIEFISLENVSSATATKGQSVRLAVAKDVLVKGLVVIPKGTLATGVVSQLTKGVPGKRDGYLLITPRLILNNGKTIKMQDYSDWNTDFGPAWFMYTFLGPIFLPILILSKLEPPKDNKNASGTDVTIHACGGPIQPWYTKYRTRIQSIYLPAVKPTPENAIPCILSPGF
jgi:hypothetical protein